MNDIRAALALDMTPDIGPATVKKLVDFFGAPSHVIDAGVDGLLDVAGLGIKRAKLLNGFNDWSMVDQIMNECGRKGIKTTFYGDENYPELLGGINDPPIVLYYRGDLNPLDKYAISIVGSRSSTAYGKRTAQYIAEGLSSMGFTIVSGMARGIDSIAHLGALGKGARTLAVLGSGIDVVYPPESLGLYQRIQGSGAVMSEFPLGTLPHKENFPRRNRIISGLSFGVIVVEASKGSGSLITAKTALEQGREVFAVPGNIGSANSYGSNDLLKQGAKVMTHPDDVVRELGHVLKGFIKADKRKEVEVSEEEKRICDILSGEPVHIDEITRKAGYPSSKVLGLLLGLELKSVVHQMEGKKFSLIQEERRV